MPAAGFNVKIILYHNTGTVNTLSSRLRTSAFYGARLRRSSTLRPIRSATTTGATQHNAYVQAAGDATVRSRLTRRNLERVSEQWYERKQLRGHCQKPS